MSKNMDAIVSLCKRRGFLFQSSEIYGGFQGFWDYGPLGVELKRNVREAWWRDMVTAHDEYTAPEGAPSSFDMVGIETSIIMNPQVWKCSGHYDLFHDMMVDCRETKKRYRFDQIRGRWATNDEAESEENKRVFIMTDAAPEEAVDDTERRAAEFYVVKKKYGKKFFAEDSTVETVDMSWLGPDAAAEGKSLDAVLALGASKVGTLTEPREFNLMFKTIVGALGTEEDAAFLRPETAQGIFVNFKNVCDSSRVKIPFGVAQIGKSFRNDLLAADVESETHAIGDWLQQHSSRRKPSIFERRWWDDHILSWAMADESVKVQMFRFVDVLPMLKDHQSVSRHLQEYFEEVNDHLPGAVRMVVDHAGPNSVLGRALSMNARSNALRMAGRFIAGSTPEEVLASVTKLRKQGFAFSLDLLGEAVVSEPEANLYRNSYCKLLDNLADDINGWSEDTQIDHDDRGPIPRLNVSVKLSALYSQFSPVDPVGTADVVKKRLRTILRRARNNMAYVHVDMEQYAYKDLTLHIFKDILMEDEFRDFADVGIVIQAYLRDAENDLQQLRQWV